jgi:predicted transcriptional regulator
MSQHEIAAAIGGRRRGQSLFAVVSASGELVGVVTRWALEQWAAQATQEMSGPLASIARKPVIAYPDEPLRIVVNRMAQTGRTELPVVDRASPHKLLGRITLQNTLKARVRHLEEETRRERPLPLSLVVPRWLRATPGIPPSGRLPVEPRDSES